VTSPTGGGLAGDIPITVARAAPASHRLPEHHGEQKRYPHRPPRAGRTRISAAATPWAPPSVLEFTGRVLLDRGTDPAAGEAALTAAISISSEIGNQRGAAIAMHHLGRAHMRRGRLDDAVSVPRLALTVFEELADDYNQGRVLISLGEPCVTTEVPARRLRYSAAPWASCVDAERTSRSRRHWRLSPI
jgi:hypothetical protein